MNTRFNSAGINWNLTPINLFMALLNLFMALLHCENRLAAAYGSSQEKTRPAWRAVFDSCLRTSCICYSLVLLENLPVLPVRAGFCQWVGGRCTGSSVTPGQFNEGAAYF